jgi:hypothetical protein
MAAGSASSATRTLSASATRCGESTPNVPAPPSLFRSMKSRISPADEPAVGSSSHRLQSTGP